MAPVIVMMVLAMITLTAHTANNDDHDGNCNNSNNNDYNISGNNCNNDGFNKVFTFGIGSGASRSLVKGSAKAGKGEYTFVEDSNLDKRKKPNIRSVRY